MAQLRAALRARPAARPSALAYAQNILTLNLGHSFRHDQPVVTLIVARLWPTLLLMMTTLVLSVTVGSLLGLLAATGLHRWRDTVISIFALVSYAPRSSGSRSCSSCCSRPAGLAAHERNGEHRRLQDRLGAPPRHPVGI